MTDLATALIAGMATITLCACYVGWHYACQLERAKRTIVEQGDARKHLADIYHRTKDGKSGTAIMVARIAKRGLGL